jgi:hypothetical protein
MHASLDGARARGDRLFEENQRLQKELDQVKLELKLERQNKFATNTQKQESGGTADTPNASAAASTTDKKKRGAPVGHPGWFRKPPTQYDWAVDVAAPKECPHCSGIVRVFEEAAPAEHLQIRRMARLMTVAETAKRHGHRPGDIYYRLFTQPPGRVLRRLYDNS